MAPVSDREAYRRSIKRALIAAGMRYDGMKLREIGEQLGGVSTTSALSAVQKGQRLLSSRYDSLNYCAELVNRNRDEFYF